MNLMCVIRKHKIPPQAPKGDVKSGIRRDLRYTPDIGDESNLHPL